MTFWILFDHNRIKLDVKQKHKQKQNWKSQKIHEFMEIKQYTTE